MRVHRAFRSFTTMAAAALIALPIGATPAAAQGPAGADDDTIIVTFSGPVEVPGTTLQPGTYEFAQQDSNTHQQVVQIFNEDRSGIVATVVTIPVYRLEPAEGVVLRFGETPEGTPPALKAYFFPNQRLGHRFVYPEEQARRIAGETRTLVLSGDVENVSAGELREWSMRVVNERGESMAYAEGAVDWANRGWKNPPKVASGEDAADAYAGSMSADDRRQLLDDTAAIIGKALERAGTGGETVTIPRTQLEKVHGNLESLRGALGSGETD